MADGLTVPFALAAGLSGAVASTDVIVVAGLAEIAAGAIAMGWVVFSRRACAPTDNSFSAAIYLAGAVLNSR